MAITATSLVDQVEVTQSGIIQVRFIKRVQNGGVVVSEGYHRTAVPPGGDLGAAQAAVGAHLTAMGYEPPTDWAKVQNIATAVWTPEVVKQFAAPVLKNDAAIVADAKENVVTE